MRACSKLVVLTGLLALVTAACTKSHPSAPDTCSHDIAPLEYVDIVDPCRDGGDSNEDVDPSSDESLGRRYTPRSVSAQRSYSDVIQAKPNDLGFARIRTRLVFSSKDLRNVIGTLPSCTSVQAVGPMKNGTGSQGVGYAIRLRDPRGDVCQGYVSVTAVSVL